MDISPESPSADLSNKKSSSNSSCDQLDSGVVLRRKFGELQINTIQMSPIRNCKSRGKSSSRRRITDYFNQTSDNKHLVTSSATRTRKAADKSIQTESKCSCDYYDVEDMIMTSSCHDDDDEHYFEQQSAKLQPQVDELLRHKIQLEEDLDGKKRKIVKLKDSIENLVEIIELGREMGEIVDGYDKNVASINDSGCVEDDVSTSMTSQSTSADVSAHNVDDDDVTCDDDDDTCDDDDVTCDDDDVTCDGDDVTIMDGIREMLEDDRRQATLELEDQLPSSGDDVIAVSTSSNPRQCQNENSSRTAQETTTTTTQGTTTTTTQATTTTTQGTTTTTTIFTQTSLCCHCDWEDKEIEEQMIRRENTELDSMFHLSKLQMEKKMTSQFIEYLKEELTEGVEEVNKLTEEEERLQLRSEDVEQLTKLVQTHILGDSGIGADIEEDS